MRLPKPRSGIQVVVKGREVAFAHWPMLRTNRRFGLAHEVFTSEPWSLIEATIRDRCPKTAEPTAQSFLRQAREYARAARAAHADEARPVLYYYSFLNLGKALILTNAVRPSLPSVKHGLSENPATTSTVTSAILRGFRSSQNSVNAFDDFLAALGSSRLSSSIVHMSVLDLFGQSVIGHRLWRAASNRKERMARVSHVTMWEDPAAKELWLTIELSKSAATGIGRSTAEILQLGGLPGTWRAVASRDPGVILLEQQDATDYSHRAADRVQDVVEPLRWALPRVFSPIPSYRTYYVYLAPANSVRLPQPAAVFAGMFWLGSITRYRPQHFLDLMSGPFGPFLSEFLAVQPTQFVYECACLFRRQEVTQAAVVA